jgi:hypothetical protein
MANTLRTVTEKDLEKHLTKLQRAVEEAKQLQADLRATQQFAVGTVDVDTVKVGLITKVEALLKVAPMSLAELAVELGESTGKVSAALKTLKRKGQVWNVGEEDRPRWRWVIGDDCSFPELVAEVQRLLSERPMSHADLKAATGANPNRLKGAVTQLARNGVKVVNVSGDERRALWYVRTVQA